MWYWAAAVTTVLCVATIVALPLECRRKVFMYTNKIYWYFFLSRCKTVPCFHYCTCHNCTSPWSRSHQDGPLHAWEAHHRYSRGTATGGSPVHTRDAHHEVTTPVPGKPGNGSQCPASRAPALGPPAAFPHLGPQCGQRGRHTWRPAACYTSKHHSGWLKSRNYT